MKVSDFLHQFPNNRRSYPDIFRVRTFVNNQLEVFVVITDLLDKRTGTSVTELIEKIFKILVDAGFIPATSRIIEHYDKEYVQDKNTFSLVSFDDKDTPSWQHLSLAKITELLGATENEFTEESLSIPSIYDEVEKMRHNLNPFLDEPDVEKNEVLIRRDAIQANKVTKAQLATAVQNNSSETELHKLIQSDLSILGDYFANPKEMYICFSEFLLNDKFAKRRIDFVVFAGCSRMEVILIEIKGANYNLLNKGNYSNFSAKTNEAVQQLRDRTSCIYREYNHFRKYFHKIRKKAEKGKNIHHAFIGPQCKILVDPNKDINVHRVCIGGRSGDDIVESRLRHEYENGQSPSIKIESWDSFLNKLQRD